MASPVVKYLVSTLGFLHKDEARQDEHRTVHKATKRMRDIMLVCGSSLKIFRQFMLVLGFLQINIIILLTLLANMENDDDDDEKK